MNPIRVLVVDDSRFAREFISELLSEDSGIRVVGQAENGAVALLKAGELRPDIITMDIDMPVMDGLEAISRIMAVHAVPILVLTSRTDANTAFHAISKGALEVMPKPDMNMDCAIELNRKIKLLSRVRVISHIRSEPPAGTQSLPRMLSGQMRTCPAVIAIAASTGGPRALNLLLSAFPENFPCPVLIAQHIAENFAGGMVAWLDRTVPMKVKIGEEAEIILPGTVYVSPSEKHMIADSGKRIGFIPRKEGDIYFPSCNALLSSAARVYGSAAIGVILTGMGDDGIRGMADIKNAGGFTIAQDEKSSVVFGMPRAAIEQDCAERVLPVHKIAEEIMLRVCR